MTRRDSDSYELTCLDLFSGVGGFSIACERVGIRTVAFCEVDPFCRAVLAKHWPDVPIHGDIREFDPAGFRGVDLICGGFPCQDVSAAGKGAGIGGARSGLWVEMARIIAGVRPRWVLVENVPALRTRGADRVLADLEEIGYDAWSFVVGAWAVGAPHKRDRVWIVAHHEGSGRTTEGQRRDSEPDGRSGLCDQGDEGRTLDDALRGRSGASPEEIRAGRLGTVASGLDDASEPRRAGDAGRESARAIWDEARRAEPAGSGSDLADAAESRRPTGTRGTDEGSSALASQPHGRSSVVADASGRERQVERLSARTGRGLEPREGAKSLWPARPGEPQHDWEEERLAHFPRQPIRRPGQPREESDPREPQQPLGRATDGLPAGMVRTRRRNNREALKAYGNSIVPDCAEAVLKAMLHADVLSEPL